MLGNGKRCKSLDCLETESLDEGKWNLPADLAVFPSTIDEYLPNKYLQDTKREENRG